ncbi:S8 family serine peptidase [Streptomyces sp. SS1-1]|uniref:S8 family serine peptidase n=1 Tax=Streptomyces sp. SS1-1 TaxID=2651869 RepID=UPI001CEF5ACD|nr:S8 family serine peptidase [Streptomyces sp. SS1-1]
MDADTTVVDGETYVYPREVLPYIAAETLDKQLFNITRLLEYGYDDARSDRLPVIVRYSDSSDVREAAAPEGGESLRRLTSIQGAALAQPRDKAEVFWSSLTTGVDAAALQSGRDGKRPVLAHGIERVWLDGKVRAALSDTVAQIGAPEVWKGGNTGEGVDVAVLDTGVDTGHADLVGRIAATKSFVPDEPIDDVNGHGTHVASTIAGTGAASDGKQKGVAPGARLHIGKALDDSGFGQDSWIVAAMEWAARDQKAKVVSMSLGGGPTDGTDPLSAAVNGLSAETGALFTIAAGNSFRNSTIGTPGAADAALTVGAVDSQDTLAGFSSRGPRVGDAAVKPEITAPGVDVLAARSQYSPGEGAYTTKSGTSMATPHVAGVAALLAAEHPDWSGAKLKEALVSTAKPTPAHSPFEAGNGRVDAVAATKATVYGTGVVSVGLHEVPAPPGATVDRKVTYTNTGTSPVTLDLALDTGTAPAGLFTLSSSKVTVPPGASSSVTLSSHLDHTVENHAYTTRITAMEKGTVTVTTAVGLVTESEKAVVDLTIKDRSGKPASGAATLMAERVGGTAQDVKDVPIGSSARLRLEPGLWSFSVLLDVEGAHGAESLGRALVTLPEVKVDRDMPISLDASTTRRVSAVTPKNTATTYARVDFTRALTDTDVTQRSFNLYPHYDSFFASPTAHKVTKGALDLKVRWREEEPALTLQVGKENLTSAIVRRGAQPLAEGATRLDAVYAGQGAPEDYAGLPIRGKAALVQRNPIVTMADQAAAAAKAGAKALIVADPGPTRLDPRTPATPPLTVITVGYGEGLRLMNLADHGPVALKVSYDAETDYLYDLVASWKKSLPKDFTYRPKTEDLSKIDVSFEHHRAGEATEFRFDLEPGRTDITLGISLPTPAQGSRTDWVTAGAGVEWRQTAAVLGDVTSYDTPTALRPGSATKERWFAPVGRPRSNEAHHASRGSDYIITQLAGWGDSGSDHQAYLMAPGTTQTASLYQGDRLLSRTPGSTFIYATDLKPQRLPYRYVLETSHGTWGAPYSTRTKTSWDFVSATVGPDNEAPLPLIQLDYGIDTDTAGKAKRTAKLTLTPSHLTSPVQNALPPTSAIGKAGLEVSYDDGATWHEMPLTRTSAGWHTTLKAPQKASYVAVRATASDDRGNAVKQTIIRAFGLK